MRRFLSLLILPILAMPALAEEPAAVEKPALTEKPAPHAQRQTWEQHFASANQAHDGHLTQDEAKAGFPLIAKHFNEIDIEHRGYVTVNDIRAWRILRKAEHRLPPPDKLKPLHAFQQHLLNAEPGFPARTAGLIAGMPALTDATPPGR